jgi:Transposase DDE domain group 1
VSHAGSALLAQVADRTGLTRALSLRQAGMKERRCGHDPGRVIRDLAVMLADGGDCLADLGAVRDQESLFGAVASNSTAFRMVQRISEKPVLIDAIRAAHARAREHAWRLGVQPAESTVDMDTTWSSQLGVLSCCY